MATPANGFQSLVDAAVPGSAIQLQDEILQYPVFVDKELTIRGPANLRSGSTAGTVFVGFQRAMNTVPNPLDPTKVAYRTTNDRRIWLPSQPWNIAPPVTIKLGFVINVMPSGQVALFGAIEKQHLPAPWFCWMDSRSVTVWSAAGKYTCLFAWTPGYHEVLIHIDVASISIAVDGVVLKPSFTGPCAVASPIRTVSFGIGGTADKPSGWADMAGGSHDFSYCALVAVGGIVPNPGFFQNFSPPTPFSRLFCDAGQFVHCYGSTSHTYGAMVMVDQVVMPTPSFEDVQFNVPFWLGGVFNAQFWKCDFNKSFLSTGGWPDYPVTFDTCTVQGLLRGSEQILWMDRCVVDRMEFHDCGVAADKVFMPGASGQVNTIECLDNGTYTFRNLNVDAEGLGPIGSYWYVEKAAGISPAVLNIEHCTIVHPAALGDVRTQAGVQVNITDLVAQGRTPTVVTF